MIRVTNALGLAYVQPECPQAARPLPASYARTNLHLVAAYTPPKEEDIWKNKRPILVGIAYVQPECPRAARLLPAFDARTDLRLVAAYIPQREEDISKNRSVYSQRPRCLVLISILATEKSSRGRRGKRDSVAPSNYLLI